MLERSLQQKILLWARKLNIFCRKIEFPNFAGAPDCVFIYGGKTLWIEFKSPKGTGRLLALQVFTHDQMRAAGAQVLVIDNYDKGVECLQNFFGLTSQPSKPP